MDDGSTYNRAIAKGSAVFHDFADYEKLVEAAKREDQAPLIILLGGEAGLRWGEMMALEWSDVDLAKRQSVCSGPSGRAT
jgi:integrase